MSGSEDEADFASADEGEPATKTQEQGGQKVQDKVSAINASPTDQKETASKHTEGKHAKGKKHKKEGNSKLSDRNTNKAGKTTATAETEVQRPKEKKEAAKVKATLKDSTSNPDKEGNSEALSQEVIDKLTVSDKKNVIAKDSALETEQTKSDTIHSDSNVKDSKELANKSGVVTPAKETEEGKVVEGENLAQNLALERERLANMIKSPSSQSIQRPEPDHTREQENVLEGLAMAAKPQSGWGWGWGSSLLNVASTSVTTFTKEVGEGFHTVIETVESTLKVPAPEKLAEGWEEELDDNEENIEDTVTQEPHHQPEPTQSEATGQSQSEATGQSQSQADKSTPSGEEKKSQSEGDSWFSSWGVSNISNIVQKSGKTFVSGGLDVLETIGKKTFDVIKDHDPGLRKTKGLLFERGDKPNLSQVLKDAKEQREAQERQEEENEEARKAHFGSLFDDFQGLAHLEALEMLSNQSEKRVSSLLNALPPETITSVKPQLLEIKENFEIGEEEEEVEEQDFVRLVTELFTSLALGNSPTKLTVVQEKVTKVISELKEKLETETKPEPKEIHQTAIQSLAEFTSKSIEQFHKTGELMLIKKAEQADLVLSSKHIASLSKVLCAEVGIVSSQFTECLNKCLTEDNSAVVNPLVTNVYLEATNSSSYIQDGFQLLLPVLQQTALEKTQEPDS